MSNGSLYNKIVWLKKKRLFGVNVSFKDKIQTAMYYWLGKRHPFIINEEYRLDLLYIDKTNNSVKILITNLKNNQQQTVEAHHDEQ